MVFAIPLRKVRNCLLTALVAYLIWLRRNWRRIRALRNLPTETALGLIRKSPELRLRSGPTFKSIFPVFLEWAKKHREDGIYKISIGHPLLPFFRCMIIICDLGIAKQILHRESYQRFKKGWSYRLSHPLVGDGLLSIDDGEEWKLMRDLTKSGFKMPSMERAMVTVAQVTHTMMKRWRSEIQEDGPSSLDMYEEALRLTLDVLGLFGLSYDFRSVTAKMPEDAPLFSAFQTILTSLVKRTRGYPLSKYIPSETNRGLAVALGRLNEACEKLVQDRRSAMSSSEGGMVKDDILEHLLSRDEQGRQRLTDARILDCLKTLLFAGHDTTASTLTWALYLLAKHTNWQEGLRQSLCKVGFKSFSGPVLPSSVTYTQLDELEDLSATVKETLRLYPAAGFTREALKQTTLHTTSGKEYEVHPGAEMFLFPNIFHSDPSRFPDPDAFRPQRWYNAPLEMKEAYMPFSSGLRNCVGERLAMAELRVSLAQLVTNFRFDLEENHGEPFQVLLLSMQPYGVKLRVTPLA